MRNAVNIARFYSAVGGCSQPDLPGLEGMTNKKMSSSLLRFQRLNKRKINARLSPACSDFSFGHVEGNLGPFPRGD